MERRHNGVIVASSVIFFVKARKMAQNLVKKGLKAAGVWYRVKTYTKSVPFVVD